MAVAFSAGSAISGGEVFAGCDPLSYMVCGGLKALELDVTAKVVLGIGSFLIDPLCRMIGARLVWTISNFIVFAYMLAITILSWVSHDLYLSKLQHIIGADKTITYSVPFSVTAKLTAETGGGQGVLNLAIVAPRVNPYT
ncbi:hypothetical protein TRIUR3_31045 [Triticum urartu]|uniref:Uncharacterized protein n=1 Tax=Triticum urartu TaxID=4572 RepID=M7ZD11_TRIUA|nr:hypothetical protein TRIUR3_31045 [Triticum urartu]